MVIAILADVEVTVNGKNLIFPSMIVKAYIDLARKDIIVRFEGESTSRALNERDTKAIQDELESALQV